MGRWADLGIPAEVRVAYEDVVRAVKDIERGTEAVGKAKKWMVQASADYSIGFLDVREVSDAVQAYVTLRTGLMKARFDHNVAMASLSRATGTLDSDSDLFYLAPPGRPNAVGGRRCNHDRSSTPHRSHSRRRPRAGRGGRRLGRRRPGGR